MSETPIPPNFPGQDVPNPPLLPGTQPGAYDPVAVQPFWDNPQTVINLVFFMATTDFAAATKLWSEYNRLRGS
jgi:hypothetical protein